MFIACDQPAATEVQGTTYYFAADQFGRFVAEVQNDKHAAVLLAVVDHYRQVDPEVDDTPTPPVEPGAVALTAISPSTAEIGGADVTMTATGTGFTADSVVVFNGGEEATEFVSDTELTTVVKPSLVGAAATVPVLVRTAGADTAALDFTFTDASQPLAAAPDPIAVTEITGIGPAMEAKLAAEGITDARQIAALTPEEALALDERLALGGRIEREEWVKQAQALAA